MASSIVGALESWEDKGVIHELLVDDLGTLDEVDYDPGFDPGCDPPRPTADVRYFERIDSKFATLRDFLTKELHSNRAEKFVIFAFFKGTLRFSTAGCKRKAFLPSCCTGAAGWTRMT